MRIFVPLVVFELDGDDSEIADVILNGYYSREDAEMIHPNAEILEINIGEVNAQAN